jgi:1-deoxy-D-xylulose-5-phosphate synthase
VTELGLPDEFLEHGSRAEILDEAGLTPQHIARDVVAQVLGSRIPVARPLDETAAASRHEDARHD